jgi:dephospho-CoA kinase
LLRIGLTGGIGSGKSTVAKVFETLGIPVYYADDAAKRLMNTDSELKKNLIRQFGEQTYVNGELNRPHLASIVFNDTHKLDLLNAMVHPVTINDAAEWMKQQQSKYVIKEAALLFESTAKEGLDYIIGVAAPKHLRIKRVIDRDHVSREEILKRMGRQIAEDIKMRLCDFIIINDEQQLVIPQVLELHETLLQKSKQFP